MLGCFYIQLWVAKDSLINKQITSVTCYWSLQNPVYELGLSQLCQHNFEHNRMVKASSIMPGKIFAQSTISPKDIDILQTF